MFCDIYLLTVKRILIIDMLKNRDQIVLNSGYSAPIIGFGTAQKQENIRDALNRALEAGYRHIDTAYLYCTESLVGETLKEWFDSGKLKREDVFIVTKLPLIGTRAAGVDKYIKLSLEALKLSYVDLYLVHHPVGYPDGDDQVPKDEHGNVIIDPTTNIVEVWKAMEAQVDAGRTKSIGLSNFNARQIKTILGAACIPPANVQIELNVYLQQKELVAFCEALDITVSAYATLGSKRIRESFKAAGKLSEDFYEQLLDPVIEKIGKKHKKTAAQILLRHVIQRGIIAIPASSDPVHINEDIQVFDFNLDDEDMNEIYLLDKGKKARLFGARFMKGMDLHPEYPYNDPY